jgi:hypothetical protein
MSAVKPIVGTNTVYANNGAMTATPITSFEQINNNALFQIKADVDGPNSINGMVVNRAIIGSSFTQYTSTSTQENSVSFEFYLPSWTRTGDIMLEIPVTCGLRENVVTGSTGLVPANITATGILKTENFVSPTYNWRNYCVPMGALSKFFNKVTMRMGNLVEILNSYETAGLALAYNSMAWNVGCGSTLENYKRILGDPYSLQNIQNFPRTIFRHLKSQIGEHFENRAFDNITGDRMVDDSYNPSNFLNMFNGLLHQGIAGKISPKYEYNVTMGFQEKILRVPLAALVPMFQTDMMLPPTTRLSIVLELPIVKKAFYDGRPYTLASAKTMLGFGNWNILAFPTNLWKQTANKDGAKFPADFDESVLKYANNMGSKVINFNLGDSDAGLMMGMNSTKEPQITVSSAILDPTIANSLANARLYQPAIYNSEELRLWTTDLKPGVTNIDVQIQPNQQMPQQLMIGFMNTSRMGPLDTAPYNNATFTFDTQFENINNPAGIFPNDPFYMPILKMEITMGSSPYVIFDNTKFDNKLISNFDTQIVPIEYAVMKDFGNLQYTDFHNNVLDRCYSNRNLNNKDLNKYMLNRNICISQGCPAMGSFFTVMLIPDKIDRGLITGDLGTHTLSLKITFDTQSVFWPACQKMVGNDTKIVAIIKESTQIRYTVDGDVKVIKYPSMLVSDLTGGGNGSIVIGNPPNGSRF